MTRERLVEIMDGHISVAVPVGTEYANIRGLDLAADAILAEMAGEWNAVERLARAVEAFIAEADKDPAPAHCPDPPWLKAFRSAIRALRRPDAAPARPATPSLEEVARAIDPVAMSNRTQAEPWKFRRGVALERAADVLALFAKERS